MCVTSYSVPAWPRLRRPRGGGGGGGGGGDAPGDGYFSVVAAEAAQDQQTAALVLANVGQDVLVLHEVGNVGTTGDNGQLLTQGDEAPVVGQDPPPPGHAATGGRS